jgi:hypothetical protein
VIDDSRVETEVLGPTKLVDVKDAAEAAEAAIEAPPAGRPVASSGPSVGEV